MGKVACRRRNSVRIPKKIYTSQQSWDILGFLGHFYSLISNFISFILDSFFSFFPFYVLLKVSNKRIKMSQISQISQDQNSMYRYWFLFGKVISLWNGGFSLERWFLFGTISSISLELGFWDIIILLFETLKK